MDIIRWILKDSEEDKVDEASWGLRDRRDLDITGPSYTTRLDNLFPKTEYTLQVRSENKTLKKIKFNTLEFA